VHITICSFFAIVYIYLSITVVALTAKVTDVVICPTGKKTIRS